MESRFDRDLLTSSIPELRRKIGASSKTIKFLSFTVKSAANGLKSVNTSLEDQKIRLKIDFTPSSKKILTFVSKKLSPKKAETNPKLQSQSNKLQISMKPLADLITSLK
jgi:peptidyl-tRNA hydrolase